MDWEACQLARLSAEKTLSNYRGSSAAKQLNLSRTACLLKLLTAMPPDRVGVYRLLQLGSSLKANDDGFQMDLSEPGAHKTAAIFGPTEQAITVANRLRVGSVYINGGGAIRMEAPMGGLKQSGIGREYGEAGFKEYLEPQHIQWSTP